MPCLRRDARVNEGRRLRMPISDKLRRMGAMEALRRGPLVFDARGRPRPLAPPSKGEFLLMLASCTAVMMALYVGLGDRNAALLREGAPLFVPRTAIDDAISLVPAFVIPYYSYFPLLFFLSVIAIRDRRVLYESVVGYLTAAAIGFLTFWLLPSRMLEPDLSACPTLACRLITVMQGTDQGFNIFPSLHVTYSTLVWLFYRRYMPEVGRPLGVLVYAIALSTLFCKRHYLVDIPAAVAVAVGTFHVAVAAGPRLAMALRRLGPGNAAPER